MMLDGSGNGSGRLGLQTSGCQSEAMFSDRLHVYLVQHFSNPWTDLEDLNEFLTREEILIGIEINAREVRSRSIRRFRYTTFNLCGSTM
jgi:hypothetical protein